VKVIKGVRKYINNDKQDNYDIIIIREKNYVTYDVDVWFAYYTDIDVNNFIKYPLLSAASATRRTISACKRYALIDTGLKSSDFNWTTYEI